MLLSYLVYSIFQLEYFCRILLLLVFFFIYSCTIHELGCSRFNQKKKNFHFFVFYRQFIIHFIYIVYMHEYIVIDDYFLPNKNFFLIDDTFLSLGCVFVYSFYVLTIFYFTKKEFSVFYRTFL